jgi:hypothetical protein
MNTIPVVVSHRGRRQPACDKRRRGRTRHADMIPLLLGSRQPKQGHKERGTYARTPSPRLLTACGSYKPAWPIEQAILEISRQRARAGQRAAGGAADSSRCSCVSSSRYSAASARRSITSKRAPSRLSVRSQPTPTIGYQERPRYPITGVISQIAESDVTAQPAEHQPLCRFLRSLRVPFARLKSWCTRFEFRFRHQGRPCTQAYRVV